MQVGIGQTKVVLSAVSLTAFSFGSVSGFLFAKKRLSKFYSDLSEKEIAEAKEYYSVINKTGEFADPVELAAKYEDEEKDALEELAEIVAPYTADVVVEQTTTNVFVNNRPLDQDFDYDAELAARDPSKPYIITKDEFEEGGMEYSQSTLSFFAGDDVLADEKDEHIPDSDTIVGDDNLTRFGHGSGDNKVVYVRNEALETDFEIVKSEGKYAQEVLGFIQHSDEVRIRRFRDDDE